MTAPEGERIAALEARLDGYAERIDKLEGNQRWGVLTVLAFIIKAVFDYMGAK